MGANKARFHNYVLTIPAPKPRDSKTKPRDSPTKAGALPQLHSHDSTTTLPRFHNQNLRIPQPNSQDSTTKTSGFHNQNLAILQLTTIDSTRKTAATYFQCRKFLTSYKKLKSPTPAKQYIKFKSSASSPASWGRLPLLTFIIEPRFLEDATGTWVRAVHVLVWFKSLLVLE